MEESEESWINKMILKHSPKLIEMMQWHIDHPASIIRVCSMNVLHPSGKMYYFYYDFRDRMKPVFGWDVVTEDIKTLI